MVCSTHRPASAEKAGIPDSLLDEGADGDDNGARHAMAKKTKITKLTCRYIASVVSKPVFQALEIDLSSAPCVTIR